MNPRNTKPNYKGKLIGIENNVIFGWAYDLNSPENKIILEVLLDGYPSNLTIANMYCRDYFSKSFGDNCYGFISQIAPDAIKLSHRISLRVANTHHLLEGNILIGQQKTITKSKSNNHVYPLLDSVLIYTGGLKINGHYYNPVRPDDNPEIYFYDGDNFLFSQVLKQKTSHVFKIDIKLPVFLADGKLHSIRVLDKNKRELKGSPLAVSVYPGGIKTLIRSIVQEKSLKKDAKITDKIELLERLFEQYNKYLPASFDFENYPYWHKLFSPENLLSIRSNASILVVVYGVGNIKKSITSIEQQSFKNWSLIVIEEKVSASSIKNVQYVQYQNFNINFHIKENNSTYVTLLKAGDHLSKYAFEKLISAFEENNSWIEYSDVDFDDQSGNRSNPWFKPDWDYELFLSQNYINELFAVKSELIPPNYVFDIELLPLYCVKECLENKMDDVIKIHHISEVLYHKQYESNSNLELEIFHKSAQVIQKILNVTELGSVVKKHPIESKLRRINRPLNKQPMVSIIIPTRDQHKLLKRCISTLLKKTDYQNFEIIIIDNQSRDKKTLKYFKKIASINNLRLLDYPKQFNYSAINNYAVSQAKGEVIALVNNDIEFKDKNWLKEMVGLLVRDNVGAVGCKLIWPNGMIQHGGVVLGINGLADHAFNTISDGEPGYFHRAQVTQQYSAVTAACLLTRKTDYLSVDGLNEIDFPVAFNDVDYCLKLRQRGKRIVWTPFVHIIHAESASRGKDTSAEKAARAVKEMNNLKKRWGHELMHDPFYNPNLNLDHLSGPFNGLAIPPRKSK